ncbi:MAG: nucleotidyltransferase family protein [Bacteroidota bacterium]|nr:nucleotidyltransferase family protein [Bacteroidota bacterium]
MKQHTKQNTRNLKDGYKKYAKAIKAHWQIIQDKYKVSELGIFGSVVRGEQKKRSDIDILVDYYEIPDLLEFIALENYLEKILRKKVDLVDKKGIRPELKEIVLGEVVYI